MGSREGFTLIELMIVTVIIGVLAIIASQPLGRARDRAMVGAAKHEVRAVANAIGVYEAMRSTWPTDLDQLEDVKYRRNGDIVFCRFELVPASAISPAHVKLEASHRRSKTHVVLDYPAWGERMDEVESTSPCND
jgi:prepilin-type N-terminal cleavage/methylation domain-containing protein